LVERFGDDGGNGEVDPRVGVAVDQGAFGGGFDGNDAFVTASGPGEPGCELVEGGDAFFDAPGPGGGVVVVFGGRVDPDDAVAAVGAAG